MPPRNPHIYGAGKIIPNPKWRMAAHFHSFHEIIVVQEGRMLLKSEEKSWTLTPGDILFYRAGFVHEEISDPDAPVGIHFMSFETKAPLPWLPLRLFDAHGRVRQLITWLVDDERDRHTIETRSPLFEVLLAELHHLCTAPRDPWVENILTFIRANLTRPLTLDDLADYGNMSKFAFVRKFKRSCGQTPMEKLRLIRLDEARTLLLTTNLPVKAIAPAVGIGDEFQLSKLFRSHFNLSPRDFRTRSHSAIAN